jgi:hypothetical protein
MTMMTARWQFTVFLNPSTDKLPVAQGGGYFNGRVGLFEAVCRFESCRLSEQFALRCQIPHPNIPRRSFSWFV